MAFVSTVDSAICLPFFDWMAAQSLPAPSSERPLECQRSKGVLRNMICIFRKRAVEEFVKVITKSKGVAKSK